MEINKKSSDIEKIIKRLILIKGLISLEEEEDILEQLSKLMTFQIDDDITEIISHIKKQSYGKATVLIDKYINSYNQITAFIDPEIEALRFEAKTLERQIQGLSNEKSELDKLIREFSARHNHELGDLILKILIFRKEQLKDSHGSQEAEKDYNDFFYNYEISKNEKIPKLSEKEQNELKANYRKATKLCHPDIVDNDQQEAAHKIFIELKDAYERNDLKKVSEILYNLQQGKAFTSKADLSDEKLILQQEIERLRCRLNELKEEINKTKESDTFITISNIKDWDSYFSETKLKLQQKLYELENEG